MVLPIPEPGFNITGMTAIFPVLLLIADKCDAAMSADCLLSGSRDHKLPMTVPPFLSAYIRAEAFSLMLWLLNQPSAALPAMMRIICLLSTISNPVATAVRFNGVFRNPQSQCDLGVATPGSSKFDQYFFLIRRNGNHLPEGMERPASTAPYPFIVLMLTHASAVS